MLDVDSNSLSHHAAYGVPLEKLHVAVIDDVAQMAELLRLMLLTVNVGQIRAFTGPEQFIQDCREDPPHVLISDLNMKPVNGFELIDRVRVRKMDPLCFMAIVAISSHSTAGNIKRALLKGANDFLVKPLSVNTLRKCLERVTDDRRLCVLERGRVVLKHQTEIVYGDRDTAASNGGNKRMLV